VEKLKIGGFLTEIGRKRDFKPVFDVSVNLPSEPYDLDKTALPSSLVTSTYMPNPEGVSTKF